MSTYSKILLATCNKSKKVRAEKILKAGAIHIRLVSPADCGIDETDVAEDGTQEENAVAKAHAYEGKVTIPILANDTALYIEGEEIDPVKVKRNALEEGEEQILSQEEIAEKMRNFYQHIAARNGGAVGGRWVDIWALILPDGTVRTRRVERLMTLTDKPHGKLDIYFPVRQLYIPKATGKYALEQTDEEELIELRPISEAIQELVADIV